MATVWTNAQGFCRATQAPGARSADPTRPPYGLRDHVAWPAGGVGLDSLIGIVPIAGDALSALIGLYSVLQARELGASRWLQARMVGNLVVDAALGVVPIAGDVADVFFRAHRRNLALLQRELKEPWIEAEVDRLPRRRR